MAAGRRRGITVRRDRRLAGLLFLSESLATMNDAAKQIESRVRQLSRTRSAVAGSVAYRCGLPLETWQAVLEFVRSNPASDARASVAERFSLDTANRIFDDIESANANRVAATDTSFQRKESRAMS